MNQVTMNALCLIGGLIFSIVSFFIYLVVNNWLENRDEDLKVKNYRGSNWFLKTNGTYIGVLVDINSDADGLRNDAGGYGWALRTGELSWHFTEIRPDDDVPRVIDNN